MTQVSNSLETALMLHQSGRLQAAEKLYREIVRADPFDSDALHLLGVAVHQQGRNDEAVESILQAIAVRPNASAFHNNLGAVFHALGRSSEAVAAYHQAIRLNGNDPDSHFNLANVLLSLNQLEDAATSFEKTVALRPMFVEAQFSLGKILRTLGRSTEAESCFKLMLQMEPDHAEAHNYLGTVVHDQGRIEEAISSYRDALELNSEYAVAHNNLGTALKDRGDYEDAIHHYQQALKLKPRLTEVYFNLGNAFREQGLLEQAVGNYHKALYFNPDDFQSRVNLAVTHKDRAEPAKAVLCYQHVLRDRPDNAEARFNRALLRLQAGDYQFGWDEYEWRWKYNEVPPRFQFPEWDGSSLEEKTILIYAEQGVGDEVMFASCLPQMIQNAKQCLVECEPRLLPLLERAFPQARFLAKPADQNRQMNEILASVNCQSAIGSLPRWLRRSTAEFPPAKPYLLPDPQQRNYWKNRLADLGSGLKIGISWRGGKDVDVRRKRSTTLTQWKTLLKTPNVHWLNLQYGDCSAELRQFQNESDAIIHDFDELDPLADLDGFAALISELDLVISIDNSTVHLAGASGIPTWILLPHVADWRWLRNQETTPWYSSVKLFRQPARDDWTSLFQQVSHALQTLPD